MANRTGKGGFKEHPENKNKSGQRNKEAVAFSRSLRELIVREGERSLTLDGKRHRKVELMVRQLWAKAIAGEAWAVAYISDRVEGRVVEQVQLSGGLAIKGYCEVSPDDWDTADAGDSNST